MDDYSVKKEVPFTFEKLWLYCEGIYDVVNVAQRHEENCSPDIKLSKLLQKTKAILRWKTKFKNLFSKGLKLYDQIHELQI